MPGKAILLAGALFAIGHSGAHAAEPPHHPALYCHRTANKDAPENTLDSLEQAALLGCDVIEIDVRRTLDGVLVLNHDGFLERLSDGEGAIDQRFYAELEHLDAGAWIGSRFAGDRIATGRVKTDYSEDEMPLHSAFAEILSAWHARCPASEEGWVFPNPNTGGVWHASVLQGDILVPTGKEVGIERLGWHTFRHSYRSMLDACAAPIGGQQKLMRHAQVSTTMKYGNAYMTEKRKAHGAVVQMVLPARTDEKAEARSASA